MVSISKHLVAYPIGPILYAILFSLLCVAKGDAQATKEPGSATLASTGIKLVLDPSSGYSIVQLRDPQTGTDFAAAEAKPGLYRILMSRADGSSYEITSKSAKSLRTASHNEITLTFDHPSQSLRVICRVRLDASPQRLTWALRIENRGSDGVRSVFYPQWIAPLRLSESPLKSRILYPSMDGQEYVDPADHIAPGQTVTAGYPGLAAIQMIAYHNGSAGLLEMTRDGGGENKHFRIQRRPGGFDLSIEHNPGETPGTNINLPYESSMEVFHGDWHEAAVEEPCEYFIPYWDLYMGRPYEFFGTGSDPSSWRTSVPLFLYVYHEYLLGYGGSNEIDVTDPYAEAIKVARKFTTGTLLEIDPGKPAFRLDSEPSPTDELRLARSCSLAQRTYANDFVIFGKMLRDPRLPDRRTRTLHAWHDPRDPHPDSTLPTVDVPLVLESTWEFGQKVAYVFANWQTDAQDLVFEPQMYRQNGSAFKLTAYDDAGSRLLARDQTLPRQIRIRIPALSAAMVEQSAE